MAYYAHSAKVCMHTLYTHLYLLCKVCILFQPKPSKNLAIQHDAHARHTGLVQVVRKLYRRLHVGLDAAAAERCLVVSLLRLGLDGRLHLALGDVRGDGPGPAYRSPVARSVHHGVRLLRTPKDMRCMPNGNSFVRVASASRLMELTRS
jgi:hypothetical protein